MPIWRVCLNLSHYHTKVQYHLLTGQQLLFPVSVLGSWCEMCTKREEV